MEYTYQKTVTVTVEDVYGLENPSIPKGWESTDEFRPPKKEENYLSTDGYQLTSSSSYSAIGSPRIILRKKKIKRIIYTQVRTGTPQPGEFYPSNGENGEVMFKCKPGNDDYMKNNYPNVPIFKREEEEV